MNGELQKVQYELIPQSEFVGLKQYDFEQTIFDLNSQIDVLSSQADSLDYIVAIASGRKRKLSRNPSRKLKNQ